MVEAMTNLEQSVDLIDRAIELLDAEDFETLSMRLAAQEPVEIARLLESLPDPRRAMLWKLVPQEIAGEVLQELGLNVEQIAALIERGILNT